jgi:L-Ala-D/L-Glu epimerase / N-acetyl-D-glutamate racemase
MKLTWRVSELSLREPLRISRSVMARRDAVEVVLEHDGACGLGEVVSSRYQQLDVTRIVALLEDVQYEVGSLDNPEVLRSMLPELSTRLSGALGVLAALDAAVHDLIGIRREVPVHELLGYHDWKPVQTAYTIGMISEHEAAGLATALTERGFGVLKVKVGAPEIDRDRARVAAVRAAAPSACLLLDPNGAWTPKQAVYAINELARFGVDCVEQPIPAGTPNELAWVSDRCEVPLIADEDAATLQDVERLAGAVRGVNIKLAQCGGLHAALQIVQYLQRNGMDVMLGCLVASSLGIAPAVHLTGSARWVDLDGHLLLTHDPWTGIGGENGMLTLAGHAGLGVTARGADR